MNRFLPCLKAWIFDWPKESPGTPDWGQLLAISVLDLGWGWIEVHGSLLTAVRWCHIFLSVTLLAAANVFPMISVILEKSQEKVRNLDYRFPKWVHVAIWQHWWIHLCICFLMISGKPFFFVGILASHRKPCTAGSFPYQHYSPLWNIFIYR